MALQYSPKLFLHINQPTSSGANAAMRTITGSHRVAPVDHLHRDTRVFPVHRSITMRGQQYLTAALSASHPSHATASTDSGRRCIRHTFQSWGMNAVEGLDSAGVYHS